MLNAELLSKIRKIEIQTRRLLSGSLVGDFTTAQKGSGFEFDQLREYQQGDDIRFIDWKSSARTNKIMIRQYLEERNRSIILMVDVSASTLYGSQNMVKYDLLAQAASVLALVGQYGKDATGLICFGSEVEYSLPPKRGRAHVQQIMKKLLSYEPKSKATNFASAISSIISQIRKKSIIFMLSDFIGIKSEELKKIAALGKKHEIVLIRVRDKNELSLPSNMLITVQDIETGQEEFIDTKGITDQLAAYWQTQNASFKKTGVTYFDISPDKSFIEQLILFFRRQMTY